MSSIPFAKVPAIEITSSPTSSNASPTSFTTSNEAAPKSSRPDKDSSPKFTNAFAIKPPAPVRAEIDSS